MIDQLEAGDTALFYFSGHGVSAGGVNYLIPSDMNKPPAGDGPSFLEHKAISLKELIRAFSRRRRALEANSKRNRRGDVRGIFILEAGRNESAGEGKGDSRRQAAFSGGSGIFVLYAAQDGRVALDRLGPNDPDSNSLFTRHLLPLLSDTRLSMADIARKVRQRVFYSAQKNHLGEAGNQLPRTQTPAIMMALSPREIFWGKVLKS